jgi:hypothetical protein
MANIALMVMKHLSLVEKLVFFVFHWPRPITSASPSLLGWVQEDPVHPRILPM